MTLDVGACLRAKAQEGIITRERARKAAQRYAEIREELDDALAAGDQLYVEQLEALRRKQWTRLNEARRQHEAIQRITRHQNQGANRIAKSFFEFISGQQIGEVSIAREFDAVRNNTHALMMDTIQRFEPRRAGLVNPAKSDEGIVLERDIVRELHGVDTGVKEAKVYADGIRKGLEYLRTEFNRVGGNVGKLDHYMPQVHDPRLVGETDPDEWIDTVMPMLDREKMINEETGQIFTDDELRAVLRDVYDNIVTRGLNDLEPTKPKFGTNLTTRHQYRRFLHFRSPDDWIEYQRQFGPGGKSGDNGKAIFAVLRHVETMSRDIAAMRVLGPNPQSTIRLINETLQARGGNDQGDLMDRLFREVTGKTNAPVNEQVAGWGISTRNVLSSSILGQAFFSALTDIGFSQTAAMYAGLPQFRLLRRQLSLFNPANQVERRQSMRLLGAAMGSLEQAQAAGRMTGDTLGDPGTMAGATRQLNDAVMRMSLLQPWTEATRRAFGVEVLTTLTERAGVRFDQLEDGIRQTMQRNGIDAATWDTIRKSTRYVDPETGADFIRPVEIMQSGNREAANALQRMISTETEFAVPSNFATARSFLRFGTRPGTIPGEIVRSTAMLKNFPVTVMMLQWGRIATTQGGLNKTKYGALLMATTGAMGVLAEQLSTIADGKKPRPMDGSEGTVELMADGLWRAGTFGLMGDLVFTNYDKFGTSLGESLAGPFFGAVGDFHSLTTGNIHQALTDDDITNDFLETTDIGRDAVRFAEGITPGNTLWWSKLAVQRMFWDQLQIAADPEYANSFRRMEQIAEDQGTEFFFKPQPIIADR